MLGLLSAVINAHPSVLATINNLAPYKLLTIFIVLLRHDTINRHGLYNNNNNTIRSVLEERIN